MSAISNTANTATPAEKLWCIHIPGPDDLHAAPDEQTARIMAEKHNAAMNKWLDAEPNRRKDFGVLGESAMAIATEWPGDEDGSHAEALKEFNAEKWGFGRVLHLPSDDTEGGHVD